MGTTLSGKTTLAKKLAKKAYNIGRNVFVLDPLLDPAWREIGANVVITSNPQEFIVLAKSNKNCTLVIDEAGNFCGQYDKEAWWLATQARHWGHQSIFIGQRANMIAKNIRDNCGKLFCFRISPSDAKTLSDDFCFESILDAPNLQQGECFYCPRYGEVEKFNIFA